MKRNAWALGALATVLVVALVVMTGLYALPSRAQEPAMPIVPGQSIEETIGDRYGDLWSLYACEGDTLYAMVEGDGFTPYLEVYAPGDEEPVAEGESSDGTATLSDLEIDATGFYTVAVTGERRSDRGDYSVEVAVNDAPAGETPDAWLPYGYEMTGTVRTRFGDLWQFHGCEGDVVTIAVTSASYTPAIELTSVADGESLTSVEGEGDEAVLEGFEIPATGDYQVTIGGVERSDRGAYSVSMRTEGMEIAPGASAPGLVRSATRTPTPTRRPGASATRTPTPTQTSSEPSCTAKVQGLNLRAGPGTAFNPPIGSIALGAQLLVRGRDQSAGWIEVEVAGTGQRGWVSAGTQYVGCSVAISSIPLAAVIPTAPTATPTNTPVNTPTSTPTDTPRPPDVQQPPPPPAQVILPAGGPGGDEISGDLTRNSYAGNDDHNDPARFTEQIWMRMEMHRTPNGSPVDHVDFTVTDSNSGEVVHEQREGTYGFCLFGGGEPNCNTLHLDQGAVWPSTGTPVHNGEYEVRALVTLEDGSDFDGNAWGVTIRIDSGNLPNADGSGGDNSGGDNSGGDNSGSEPPPLESYLVEAAPGSFDQASGQATMWVAAWDPSVGTDDGDGIDEVHLELFDPDGTMVHDRNEGTAGFCLFGGGEPDCTVFDYAANGYVWDTGIDVVTGDYTLRATVRADDGRTQQFDYSVTVN